MQRVCDALVGETDNARACVLLDLEAGQPLAASHRPNVEPDALQYAAERAAMLFRGKLLRLFTRALPGTPTFEHFVREAQLGTDDTRLFMAAIPRWPSVVLVLVIDRSATVGMGWMALRKAVDQLVPARPEAPPTAPRTTLRTPEVRRPPPSGATRPPSEPERSRERRPATVSPPPPAEGIPERSVASSTRTPPATQQAGAFGGVEPPRQAAASATPDETPGPTGPRAPSPGQESRKPPNVEPRTERRTGRGERRSTFYAAGESYSGGSPTGQSGVSPNPGPPPARPADQARATVTADRKPSAVKQADDAKAKRRPGGKLSARASFGRKRT